MRFLVAGERPTWSPDGGRIAFQRGGRVRVINADGTGEVSLGLGVEPAWAPDGERLAFTGPDGIQVMRDDGTEVSTLVPNGFRADSWTPDYIGVSKPRWSPDGTQLAFVHQGAGEFDAAEIFVVQNRGGAPRRVTSYAGLHYPEADPVWTPDGSELVFFSSAEGVAAVSAAGGTPVPLYKNWPIVAYGARPVVAPDGRVCFTAVWGTVSAWSIWCIDRQDGSLQVLLDGALHAVWSPDGGAIAFEAHMPLGSQ